MSKLLIVQSFHVFAAQPQAGAKPVAELKVAFSKGQVLEEDKVPAGQSADDWIAKGLAKRPDHPLDHDRDGRPGGSLPKQKPAPETAAA